MLGKDYALTRMMSLGTIRDLVDAAFVLIEAKHMTKPLGEYQCVVSKRQVQWYVRPSHEFSAC